MKATLSFDLSEPDQRVDHLKAVHAQEAFDAIRSIIEAFRQLDKYTDMDTIPLDEARQVVYENIPEEIFHLIHS